MKNNLSKLILGFSIAFCIPFLFFYVIWILCLFTFELKEVFTSNSFKGFLFFYYIIYFTSVIIAITENKK
jgi:hypothetical protein